MRIIYLLICFSLNIQSAFSESEKTHLAEPLDLDTALSFALDEAHPEIMTARAQQLMALSTSQLAESGLALQVGLELEAGYIEPSSLALNQDNEDHRASLNIYQPLYDFSQTENKILAADMELKALEKAMQTVFDGRRIDIAKHFFDVLLSDFKYAWHTELTVLAYVHNESVKDRHALGEVSDVALLKANHEHQVLFQQRAVTQSQQQNTRASLAETLNRPGELSSNLRLPKLIHVKRHLPNYEVLLARMMQKNSHIILQETRLEAAHKRLQAARNQMRPLLSAQLKVSEHSRDSASNNDWRAALNLSFPLYEHSAMKSEVSLQRSNWLKQRAMLLRIQSRLRQNLYELWQRIQTLSSARQQLLQSMQYRELELDLNRALYEMEVKTDLGSAMVGISEMRYRQAKTDFELSLAWMELFMLLDEDLVKGDLSMAGKIN